MTDPGTPSSNAVAQQKRGIWLRTLHQWHWISSAICLIGMLLFAITGITLNHASKIEGQPAVEHRELTLPAQLLKQLNTAADANTELDAQPIPDAITAWLSDSLNIRMGRQQAEWSDDEVYLSMPGPGRDAWISIQRTDGAIEFERTKRGWISYFNDLHKGRNTGPAWRWFIDIFSIACIVFTVTGLLLLQLHARQRQMTWPMVGLGLLIPFLIALIFIH